MALRILSPQRHRVPPSRTETLNPGTTWFSSSVSSVVKIVLMLTAEIIAIGSELLGSSRTDTNSLWLTDQLNRIGIDVKLKTIVGDDDARLEEAVKDAVQRSPVALTTGGLAHTEDAISR